MGQNACGSERRRRPRRAKGPISRDQPGDQDEDAARGGAYATSQPLPRASTRARASARASEAGGGGRDVKQCLVSVAPFWCGGGVHCDIWIFPPSMPSASTSRGGTPLGAHSAVVHVSPGRMGFTEQELSNIHNARWLEAVINWLSGFRNDTHDFSRPQLRLGIEPFWGLFVALYGAVVVLGLIMNVLAITRMWRAPGSAGRGASNSRGPRTTMRLLTNICVANMLQCAVVLPLSAIVLMVQNWVFGPVMCYVLPMIQTSSLQIQTGPGSEISVVPYHTT
ncbi:uncharacterized protein LOC127750221 [Frankliniella occidentalis]|uniref:Uncharacterized protein LOC127750221 n=1 Tax=Frankliniella occidentalis TaxID=133901 RepID=A0A9C6XPZ5_FRAOC|nr:uncharacterized protein LOC127750221 [Frankliniella occidentalis]